MGIPNLIKPDMINLRRNIVLIDVGLARNVWGKLVGDIDPECKRGSTATTIITTTSTSYFSPVPGGVGPLTVAYLMKNTVSAAFRSLAPY